MKNAKKILCVLLTLCLFLQTGVTAVYSVAGNMTAADNKSMYLSDITPVYSKIGWGSLTNDLGLEGSKFSLKINGVKTEFNKSVVAHASSDVVYDLGENHGYEYFDCYAGVDYAKTEGDAKVSVFSAADTGADFTNVNDISWTEELSSTRITGTSEAVKINFSVENVRYIRIVFDSNGVNSYDHTGVGNARVYAGDPDYFVTENLIKDIDYYKEKFAGLTLEEITEENTLEALRFVFVSKIGYDRLHNAFLYYGHKQQERLNMMNWLWNDEDALREFIAGGEPDGGNYVSALDVLSELYNAHGNDLSDTTALEYFNDYTLVENTGNSAKTLGELYRTVMFSIALTHASGVYSWLNNNIQSDPVERYEIYKTAFADEVNSLRHDIYENLCVEEMRWVMGTRIYNDEILWLNAYTRENSSGSNLNYPNIYSPHRFLKYGKDWDNAAKGLYDEDNYNNIYSDKYSLKKYGVEFARFNKLWMIYEGSHICWGISYTGTNYAAAFGVPSHYALQPGHAVWFIYNRDSSGNGIWGIDNNISGWAKTRTGETVGRGYTRMINDWGTPWTKCSGDWSGSYLLLAQHALNNYADYEKAELMLGLENLYATDSEKESVYNAVLDIMPYHFDAWYNLVNIAVASGDIQKMTKLADRISENMYEFPYPMHDLLSKLKTAVSGSSAYSAADIKTCLARINTTEKNALVKGTDVTKNNSDVAQPDITSYLANSIIGNATVSLATFSFSGTLKNNIVFGDTYKGVRFCYSLDGGTTWSETHTTTETITTYLLSDEEIAGITAENDILIWLEGWQSENENQPTADGAFRIDIQAGKDVSGIEANDNENRFLGDVSGMEYSTDGGNTWNTLTNDVKFDKAVTVKVVRLADGTTMQGNEKEFTFTDNGSEKRSYITIDRQTLIAYSSEQGSQNDYARHAIDGLSSTRWHTNWTKDSDLQRYITVKTDTPVYFSGVDYLPCGGNGTVLSCDIYVSLDGSSWCLAGSASNWANNTDRKSLTFPMPVYGQYIKFVCTNGVGGFCSAKSIEFFEDLTYSSKTMTGIRLLEAPSKQTYCTGESIDITGLKVEAVYDDNSATILPNTLLTLDNTVFYSTGSKKINLSYGSFAPVSFNVNVTERDFTPDKISVVTMPEKTEYYRGDALETEGLTVSATNGSRTVLLTEDEYTVSATLDTEGNAVCTVNYGTLSTTFNVTVKKAITSIAITNQPEKLYYELGQNFEYDGLSVTAYFEDGSSRLLSENEYFIDSVDTFTEEAGSYTLTVELFDKKTVNTSLNVYVYPYFTKDSITYEVGENKTCAVTAIRTTDSFVTIPSSVRFGSTVYTITEIESDVLDGTCSVTEISIPGTVTSIATNAFTGCEALKNVYLTAHSSFDNFTVEEDAFATDTNIILYANGEELTEKLKQIETLDNVSASDVSTLITGITVTPPEKLSYSRNAVFDISGMSVEANLSTSVSVPLSNSVCTVSSPDMTTAGQKSVTVTLTGTELKDTFDITVFNSTLRITENPVDAVYYTLDTVVTPLKVAAVSDNETDKLTYQWYCSKTGEINHSADLIEGAVSDTYTPEENGFYYARVGIEGTDVEVFSLGANISRGNYAAVIGTRGYDSIATAFAEVLNGETVILLKDAILTSTLTVSKNITLDGNGHTLTRGTGFTAPMINTVSGGKLTADNVTLDGGTIFYGDIDPVLKRPKNFTGVTARAPIIKTQGSSEIILGKDVILQNNLNFATETKNTTGGAIYSENTSKVTLNGTKILNCYSDIFGSAIYHRDQTTLIINDCLIQGCSGNANYNTSVICTDNTSTLIFNDGIVQNCLAYDRGGAIWASKGKVEINGGIFRDISAANGAGIYVNDIAKVTINNFTEMGEIYLTSGKTITVGENFSAETLTVKTQDTAAGTQAVIPENPENASNIISALTVNGQTVGIVDGVIKIPCSSHTEVTDPAVEATCEHTGLTEGSHCSVCGHIIVAQTEIAMKEHELTSEVTTVPTCKVQGVRTYKCKNCTYSYTENMGYGEHKAVTDKAVKATCTSTGLTEGSHCSVCNTVFTAQRETGMLDHADNNNDGRCDGCGRTLSTPDTSKCSCNCHKSGFMGFIWKIQKFLYKLFGTHKTCDCGVTHY